MQKLKSFQNVYSLLSLLLVLIGAGLMFYSPQGAFVSVLVLTVAAVLRLLYTIRIALREQTAVARESASWLSSIYKNAQPHVQVRGQNQDANLPQA